jgi:hypothetical protein
MNKLEGDFGVCEFNVAIRKILAVLKDPTNDFDINTGDIDASIFAALCAAGHINHTWYPLKWRFELSEDVLKRMGLLDKPFVSNFDRFLNSAKNI